MRSLAAALLLAALGCSSARAEDGARDRAGLFPSAEARVRREAAQGAQQLERTLAALPDVRTARVQLAIPAPDQTPLDGPAGEARLSVLLQLSGPGPSDAQVTRLAQAATHRTLALPLTIERTRPNEMVAREPAVHVGPFEVAAGSAANLRATLATSLIANVALATVLLLRRRRRGPRNQQN